MKKLWIWITSIFVVFGGILLLVELGSEKNYKKSIISSRLEGYADIVSKAESYPDVMPLLPEDIRVTVISTDGNVIFDSMDGGESLDNHLDRPEIIESLQSEQGCEIRESDTFKKEYIYFARKYGDTIIRTALPFELNQRRFMHPDWIIIVTLTLLLLVALLAVMLISKHFSAQSEKAAAQKLQKQKREMTDNIAHELRTPVSSIRGYLETISQNPGLPEEKRELFLQRAYSQTLRLSELIRDISIITKIEEAPSLLSREYLGIRRISEEVFEELSAQLCEKKMTVENDIPEQTSLKGNASLIYAIFRNLVENSIKYAGVGTTVHLSCSNKPEGKVEFDYYDTGKGVDPKYLERIFERFYRIPSESASKGEGSGLGLSIVRNAVAFHGGQISVENRSEGGLEFRFTI